MTPRCPGRGTRRTSGEPREDLSPARPLHGGEAPHRVCLLTDAPTLQRLAWKAPSQWLWGAADAHADNAHTC